MLGTIENSSNASAILFGNNTVDDQPDTFNFILYKVVVPVLFGLITVIGTTGNILVIYVILSRHRMRTVTNLLLLNLAIADLSFVIVIPPSTAYQFAFVNWPFGNISCKLMHYLVNVTAYVTVYTLVLISVIRYMTVVHNVRTAHLRTKQNTVVVIVAIWIVLLSLNVPILLSYGVQITDKGVLECEQYDMQMGKRIFATFFVFAYVLPLTIIAGFSLCILQHITRHRSTMLEKRDKSASKKKQVSRLLIVVVVIFAIFWLPVHIHLLVAYFGSISQSRPYRVVSVVWYCLAYFNSCVNPIIYNCTSKEFRDAFRGVCRSSKKGQFYELHTSVAGTKLRHENGS